MRLKLALAVGVTTSVMMTAPAWAEPSASITPGEVAPGGSVQMVFDCEDPNILSDYTGTGPLDGVFMPEGQYDDMADIDIPADTPEGSFTAEIECTIVGGSTQTINLTLVVKKPASPTPTPTPSGAPKTGGGGQSSTFGLGIGALILAAGMGSVLIVRRRRA